MKSKTFNQSVSRNHLIGILSNVNQTVIVLDITGNILYYNPEAVDCTFKIFHKQLEKSQNIFGFLPVKYHSRVRDLMQYALKGEKINMPINQPAIDGARYGIEYSVFPLYNSDNEIDSICFIANEKTGQKNAEQELIESGAIYRNVIEDNTELICRYKPDGTIIFVNRAFCEFYGANELMLLGQCLYSIIPELINGTSLANNRGVNHNNPIVKYNQLIKDSKGIHRWISCADKAIFDQDGEIIEIQSVWEDLTKKWRFNLNSIR
ncbi:MAG: PAS domain S-box protein [Bacteroidetes bacterium]|nr:PAS domain S-box protein [Bacteroidota bacterium]